jgi:hypothetical protein
VRGAVVWVAEDLHAGNGGQGGTQLRGEGTLTVGLRCAVGAVGE